MINFIIADDEPLALENFASMLTWEDHGFRCVGTASNGRDALRLLSEKRVDVVFTDICMPVMDGMELCKNIKDHFPQTKVVILTVYRDFEYAKKAVGYGVNEYLLKSQIEPDTVCDMLSKLRLQIEEERERRKTEKRHYYQNAMLNIMPEKEMKFDKEESACCILIQRRVSFIDEVLEEKVHGMARISFEKIQELLTFQNMLELVQVIWVDDKSWGLLFSASEGYVAKDVVINTYMREICQKVKRFFWEEYNIEIFAVFGQSKAAPNQVKTTLEKMRDCAKYSVFLKKIPYCDYHAVKSMFKNSSFDHRWFKEMVREIGSAARKCNISQMEESFDKLYREFSVPTYDLGKFRYTYRKLLEQMDWLMQQKQLNIVSKEIAETQMFYVEDLWDWIIRQYKDIADLNEIPQKNTANRKIVQALEYVHANFDKKLTVREVGEYVGLSEVYFANLFKKETGKTFGDYLTSYRIGLAKRLIIHGDFKIYEIAEKVGYSSAQYFSQIFYKETGKTPLEYRNNNAL